MTEPSLRDRCVLFLASSGYLGYAPIVPGTFGTLPALALFPLLASLGEISPWIEIGAVVAITAVAIAIADAADRLLEEHDSRKITIDEVAGYAAAVALVPLSLETAAASFVLFRIFDVVKLWPANVIDRRMAGGAGVVLDDVAAGIHANLTLRAILWATGG